MAQPRPMLDDVELQQVQCIEVEGEQCLVPHEVPGLEGDFLQRLDRRATTIRLSGVLSGSGAREALKTLRDRFRSGRPLPFVADITTATRVGEVLIQELGVRELAGKPERFEYAFLLREYLPPPSPSKPVLPPTPPPPVTPIRQRSGTLVVEVVVSGRSGYDFDRITVTVEGRKEDGSPLPSRTLTHRTADNVWEEPTFPAGRYTATAAAPADRLRGAEPVEVNAGETARVTIVLRPDTPVAHAFIVHFPFDRAFVEPCLMRVLRRAVAYAEAHPEEKLIIVGHTDEVGTPDYNRSLADRRARTVHAALTYAIDPDGSIAEWDHIRRPRPAGESPSIHEGGGGWGTVEYQHILQDLGFYPGNVDGLDGPLTQRAIIAFQRSHGLAVDGVVGDATWRVLIRAYLGHYDLGLPPSRFLPNCEGEVLQWTSCGERMPLDSTPRGVCREPAWRPNRRTELLFVATDRLPCDIPPPDTFHLPPPEGVGGGWCLGDEKKAPCCFASWKQEPGKWLIRRADPGEVRISGTLRFEDGTPAANVAYVLTAPDGQYLHPSAPYGELVCRAGDDTAHRKGEPLPGRTDEAGRFGYPRPTPAGIYVLEIRGPYVARLQGQPRNEARGNIVCKLLEKEEPFEVILFPLPVSLAFVAADDPERSLARVRWGEDFRLRVDVPGAQADELEVELASYLIRHPEGG